jgi:hypothetical protein
VFEEAYNMEGNLKMHINRPLSGWISKLPGLVSRVTDTKGESRERREREEREEKDLAAGKGGIEGDRERDKEGDGWAALERLDDDLEQWGGSENFRKEDRFFGTLQGTVYQVLPSPDSKA